MEHSEQHMYDVVDALVRAGNRFRPAQRRWGTDPFWPTKSAQECYLEASIDFAVAKAVPGQPSELVLDEGNDLIFCALCFTAITGPAYRAETVWDHTR
ncbi:hypothetical protein [Streptomyces sp. NPDC051921]|uniref:hypothetical protein n=1 Tax=Streptomyces sp. NPDC051921 TaxID=3155806 RepID=UPI0034277D39